MPFSQERGPRTRGSTLLAVFHMHSRLEALSKLAANTTQRPTTVSMPMLSARALLAFSASGRANAGVRRKRLTAATVINTANRTAFNSNTARSTQAAGHRHPAQSAWSAQTAPPRSPTMRTPRTDRARLRAAWKNLNGGESLLARTLPWPLRGSSTPPCRRARMSGCRRRYRPA